MTRSLKRLATAAVCILMTFLACLQCGCGGGGSTPQGKNVIRLNIGTEPPTLNSRIATDHPSSVIIKMLYDGLMRIGMDDKPHPAVAERVEISDDQLTYTFHLRKSVWSNGQPVTAHDFEYSWKVIMDPSFVCEYAYQLYFIKNAQEVKEGKLPLSELGVRAVDDQTFVVQLRNPTPYFLEFTTHHPCLPIYRPSFENNPHWADDAGPDFVSNGPFNLVRWKHNNELVVQKNPLYWDAEAVKVDGIHITMVEDSNTELSLFEKGELDWAGKPLSISLPMDALPVLKAQGRVRFAPMCAVYLYLFNCRRPPLSNVNIRKALSYAIDRQAIVDNITQGNEQPALGVVSPSLALQQEPYFSDHDVATARELFAKGLQELNMKAEDLSTLTLSYNTSEGHHKIAQAIQQQWFEAFGFQVGLQNEEWKVYIDKMISADFDIARMTWMSEVRDPISVLELFKYSENSNNRTGWSNPRYTQLLNEASATADTNKRNELMHQAETLLLSEQPFAPIYFNTVSYIKNPRLQNVLLTSIGDIDFKWAILKQDEG